MILIQLKTNQLAYSIDILPCPLQITRKVIRQYVSPDGVPRQDVTMEGSHQEMVHVEEGDSFSKVVKRTVVRSEGDQTEVTD